MKLLAIAAAAGLVAATALTPTAASADRWHHGHGWRWKNVCKTTWHHGHKHRVCRRTRVRW